MPRRGHSTTIGKFAKLHRDRRVSEIRMFGELLRAEQRFDGHSGPEHARRTSGPGRPLT